MSDVGKPKKSIEELRAEIAEFRERIAREPTFAESMAQWRREFADMDRAQTAAAAALRAGGVAHLRATAVYVLRCKDCGGRPIAHITYVGGRPLLWTAQEDGTDHYAWLDSGFAMSSAWCRQRQYLLTTDGLRQLLHRRRRRGSRNVRVSHSGKRGAVR